MAGPFEKRILGPLEMQDTGHDDQNAVLTGRATGYYALLGKRRLARRMDMSNFLGAGSLYSTVGDLLKWDRALCSRQLLDGSSKRGCSPRQGQLRLRLVRRSWRPGRAYLQAWGSHLRLLHDDPALPGAGAAALFC